MPLEEKSTPPPTKSSRHSIQKQYFSFLAFPARNYTLFSLLARNKFARNPLSLVCTCLVNACKELGSMELIKLIFYRGGIYNYYKIAKVMAKHDSEFEQM